MLWLLVGLGNPGRSYAENRHNIGFMVIDQLSRRWSTSLGSKFKSEYARVRLGSEEAVLLKPMTYMNRSGIGVGLAASFFKILPENVVVVHDEIDHEFGRTQVKMGGGHAGHNGLRSIFQHYGKDFTRIRCGVGRPPVGSVSGHVLDDFSKEEGQGLPAFVDTATDCLESILRIGPRETMNRFNGSVLN